MNNENSDWVFRFLSYFYDNITPSLSLFFLLFLSISLSFSFSGKVEKNEKKLIEMIHYHFKKILVPFVILMALIAYVLAYFLARMYLPENISDEYIFNINNNLFDFFSDYKNYLFIIPVFLLPIISHILFMRFCLPYISAFTRKWRITQADNELSDIKNEIKALKPKRYDPEKYFKHGQIFIGLDKNNNGIYEDINFFSKNHLKIVGPSQTGKGVELGLLIYQFIMNGWSVWFNDIKPDDFIYSIMVKACKKFNRNLVTVDLTSEHDAMGYAPFRFGRKNDKLARLNKALQINDSGSNADYHLGRNRTALINIYDLWDGEISTLLKILEGKDNRILDEERIRLKEMSENMRNRLTVWLSYDCVQPESNNNLNIEESLKNNDVVYIRGDMYNDTIREINLSLIDELTQVCLRTKRENRTLLAIDESRFMISDSLGNSLATVLSKGMTIAMTYQAKNDTVNAVSSVSNKESLQNAIETNTQYSMYYRSIDPETALWVAEQTGTENITTTKFEKVEANQVGSEIWDKTRMVGREQQYLIPENIIKTLPETVGILIRPNKLAKIYYTSWINIEKKLDLTIKNNHGNKQKNDTITLTESTNIIQNRAPKTLKKVVTNKEEENAQAIYDELFPTKNKHTKNNKSVGLDEL